MQSSRADCGFVKSVWHRIDLRTFGSSRVGACAGTDCSPTWRRDSTRLADAEAAAELADRQRVAIGAVRATQRLAGSLGSADQGATGRRCVDRRRAADRGPGLAAADRGAGAGMPGGAERGHRRRRVDRGDRRRRLSGSGAAAGPAAGACAAWPGTDRRSPSALTGWPGGLAGIAPASVQAASGSDRFGAEIDRHHRPGRRGLHRGRGARRVGTASRGHRPIGGAGAAGAVVLVRALPLG